MSKKIIWAVIILIILAGIALAAKFFIGGDEDTWLCDNGQWVRHGHPSVPMPASGCGISPSESTQAGLANPASVNCINKGGQIEIRTDEAGGQAGFCKFTDGSECEEWAFFRGECAASQK